MKDYWKPEYPAGSAAGFRRKISIGGADSYSKKAALMPPAKYPVRLPICVLRTGRRREYIDGRTALFREQFYKPAKETEDVFVG